MSRLLRNIPPIRRAVIICFILLTAFTIHYLNTNTKATGDRNLQVISNVNIKTFTIKGSNEEEPTPIPVHLDYVVVHLDFKGMPPKLSYLMSTLATLKRHGVNGLLMQYEDMFPYEGTLASLSAAHHYKRNEVRPFVILYSCKFLDSLATINNR